MNKKILMGFVAASVALALSGCKIDLGASIPLSGLLGSELQTGSADLYVEVPACSSYEDSRQPSKGLIDAKNEVEKVIPDSTFKECFKKKFNSYAQFSAPVSYGPANKVSDSTSQIRVLYNTEKDLVYVELGPKIKQGLEQARKKPSISGGFSPSDLSVNLKIKNDTGKVVQADFAGAFIDQYPVIFTDAVNVETGKELTIRLSDVSTSRLFDPETHAWFMSNVKQ
ncbi:hypothetical protein AHR24_22590 [Salmonella enterica subsp. diarizonae]|nr:hypothetical protein [Salmonella enterica subsp. diarizonae]